MISFREVYTLTFLSVETIPQAPLLPKNGSTEERHVKTKRKHTLANPEQARNISQT